MFTLARINFQRHGPAPITATKTYRRFGHSLSWHINPGVATEALDRYGLFAGFRLPADIVSKSTTSPAPHLASVIWIDGLNCVPPITNISKNRQAAPFSRATILSGYWIAKLPVASSRIRCYFRSLKTILAATPASRQHACGGASPQKRSRCRFAPGVTGPVCF